MNFRNVLKAGSGTIISQIINLISLPILFRLFENEEFGQYALAFSTIMICGNLLLFSNNLALALSREAKNYIQIFRHFSNLLLSVGPIVALSIFLLFTLWGFNPLYSALTIASVILLSINLFFISISVHESNYTVFSILQFLLSGLTPILQISLKILICTEHNFLIIGIISSYTITFIFGTINYRKKWKFFKPNLQFLKRDLVELNHFTISSTIQYFTNLLRPNTILYALANNPIYLGLVSQVDRLTRAPTTIAQASLKPLLSNYLTSKPFEFYPNIPKKISYVWIICIPLLAGLMTVATYLLKLIVGEVDPEYLFVFNTLLIPSFFMMTLAWTDSLFSFLRKQRIIVFLDISFVVIFFLSIIVLTRFLNFKEHHILLAFSVLSVIYYLFYFILLCQKCNFSTKKGIAYFIATVLGTNALYVLMSLEISFYSKTLIFIIFSLISFVYLFLFFQNRLLNSTPKVFLLTNSEECLLGHRKKYFSWLSKKNLDITIVGPFCSAEAKTLCQNHNFKLLETNLERKNLNIIKELKVLFQYITILLKHRPQIIHSFTIKANLHALIAGFILPSTKVICSFTGLGYIYTNPCPKNSIIKKIIYYISHLAAMTHRFVFVFQNEDDKNEFSLNSKTINACSIVIPGSGVDSNFYRMEDSEETLKNSKIVRFLFAGRLLYDKGLSELLAAAQILKSESDILIQIAGNLDKNNPQCINDEDFKKLTTTANIQYLGSLKDIKRTIQKCQVALLPSYREGLPMFLLEAMSCQKPIITSDAPGCGTLVDQIKPNGIIVPIKNEHELAKAILKLYENEILRNKMGQNSRKLVLEKYSQEIVFSQLYELYTTRC